MPNQTTSNQQQRGSSKERHLRYKPGTDLGVETRAIGIESPDLACDLTLDMPVIFSSKAERLPLNLTESINLCVPDPDDDLESLPPETTLDILPGQIVDIVTQTLDEHSGANTPPSTDRPSPAYTLPYYMGTSSMGHTQPFFALPPVEDNQRSDYNPYLDLINATTTALLTNLGIDLSYGGDLQIEMGTRLRFQALAEQNSALIKATTTALLANLGVDLSYSGDLQIRMGTRLGFQALAEQIRARISDLTQQKFVFELCGVSLLLLANHRSHPPTQSEITQALNDWRQVVATQLQDEWAQPAQSIYHEPQLPSLAAPPPETTPDSAEALFATLSPANVQLLERLGQGNPLAPEEIGTLAMLVSVQRLVEQLLNRWRKKSPQQSAPQSPSPEAISTKPGLDRYQLAEQLLGCTDSLVIPIESNPIPDARDEGKQAIVLDLKNKIDQLKAEYQLPLQLRIEAVFQGEQFLGIALTDAEHTPPVDTDDSLLQAVIDRYLESIMKHYQTYLEHIPLVDPWNSDQYVHDYEQRLRDQFKLLTLLAHPQLLAMAASYSSGLAKLISIQENIILGLGMEFFPRPQIQEPSPLGVTTFATLKAALEEPNSIEHHWVYGQTTQKPRKSLPPFDIGVTALVCTLAFFASGCGSSVEANQPRDIQFTDPNPLLATPAAQDVLPLLDTQAPATSLTEVFSQTPSDARAELMTFVYRLNQELAQTPERQLSPTLVAHMHTELETKLQLLPPGANKEAVVILSYDRLKTCLEGISQLTPETSTYLTQNWDTLLPQIIDLVTEQNRLLDPETFVILVELSNQSQPLVSPKSMLALITWHEALTNYRTLEPDTDWTAQRVLERSQLQGEAYKEALWELGIINPSYSQALNEMPVYALPVDTLTEGEVKVGSWVYRTAILLATNQFQSDGVPTPRPYNEILLNTLHETLHEDFPNTKEVNRFYLALALGENLADSGITDLTETQWQQLSSLRQALRYQLLLDPNPTLHPYLLPSTWCVDQTPTCPLPKDQLEKWPTASMSERAQLLDELSEAAVKKPFYNHLAINATIGVLQTLPNVVAVEAYKVLVIRPEFSFLNPDWDGTWPEEPLAPLIPSTGGLTLLGVSNKRKKFGLVSQRNDPNESDLISERYDSFNSGPISIETLEAMNRFLEGVWGQLKPFLPDQNYWQTLGMAPPDSPASPGQGPNPAISNELEKELESLRKQIAAELEVIGKPTEQALLLLAARYGWVTILQSARNQGANLAAYLGGAVGVGVIHEIPLDNQTLFWAMLGSYLMYIPTLYAAIQKADGDSFQTTDTTASWITTWWQNFLKTKGFDPFAETGQNPLEKLAILGKRFLVSAPSTTIDFAWGEMVVLGPALLILAAPYMNDAVAQALGRSTSAQGLSNEFMRFIIGANLGATGFYAAWPNIQSKLKANIPIVEIFDAMKQGDWEKIEGLLRNFAKAVAQDTQLVAAICGPQIPAVAHAVSQWG